MDLFTKFTASFLIIYQQSIQYQLQSSLIHQIKQEKDVKNQSQNEIISSTGGMILKYFNNYFTIKYQMQQRIRSAGTLMPQPQSTLEKRKRQLESYSKNVFFRQQTNNKNLSTPFTASSKRHRLAENIHFSITPSPYDAKIDPSSIRRPFTEERCHRRLYSPLEVIRTKSKCESLQLVSQTDKPQQNPTIKVNFLKKGSGIDRAIIINILKSKLNLNVCASAFCYNDAPDNKQFAMMLQKQIPKGIRDVVGVEQMMRMSHIMTGANFKSTSLTHKLNKKLKESRPRKSSMYIQDDDHLTLKSIKRW